MCIMGDKTYPYQNCSIILTPAVETDHHDNVQTDEHTFFSKIAVVHRVKLALQRICDRSKITNCLCTSFVYTQLVAFYRLNISDNKGNRHFKTKRCVRR